MYCDYACSVPLFTMATLTLPTPALCHECGFLHHDVLCSNRVGVHLDLEEKLRMIGMKNTITISCDGDKDVFISGRGGVSLESLYSVHWSDLKSSDFNRLYISHFMIDESNWADLYCERWLKETYPGQLTLLCKRVSA